MSLTEELIKTRHWTTHRHPHAMGSPLLKVEHLSLRYDGFYALEDISFEIKHGERVAIVGPNGAGKSTLLKIVAGVLKPSEGNIDIYGHEPSGHICIGYVPQRNQVDWNFPVTVRDVVMMGRIGKLGLFHNPTRHDWEIVQQALETVGITPLAHRLIHQLSGGQQQRMFIARALAQEAELLLLDEPLTGLDITTQEDIFRILEILQAKGVTVLLALHDLKLAEEHFDKVLLLNGRLIAFGNPAQVLQPDILLQAYGGHLHFIQSSQGLVAVEGSCCEGRGEHP
ncbi:MAG: metal ABC transporter ATP-binding protein [Anaerolineales bacterium]